MRSRLQTLPDRHGGRVVLGLLVVVLLIGLAFRVQAALTPPADPGNDATAARALLDSIAAAVAAKQPPLVLDSLQGRFAGLLGNFTRLVQLLHGGTVIVTGDTATATWYITELAGTDGGKAFHFVGVYRDELARTAEGWRFTKRAFDFLYRAKGDAEARWAPHPAAVSAG